MKTSDEITRLWHDCFPSVSNRWIEMFLRHVDLERDLVTARDANGHIVSSLLLEQRQMSFHDTTVPVSYLSFACTAPRFRAMGSMRHLLSRALELSRERGDMAVMLIPAADWLSYYYERAGGWANIVYVREDNYTCVHRFSTDGYRESTVTDSDKLFDAFSRLERRQGRCVVLHSHNDFDAVVEDCRMEHGKIAAVSPADNSDAIAAIAVAVADDFYNVATVKMLSADCREAAEAVLEYIRLHFPGKRLRVLVPAPDYNTGGGRRHFIPTGMGRIVNPAMALEIIANNAHHGWHKTLKITDKFIADNNGWFVCGNNRASHIEGPSAKPDFDVDISVFTRMVFGSGEIGEMIDFPAVRPTMNLMLE